MEENYNNKPLLLVTLIILFLIAISFLGEFNFGKLRIKKIDFFADIRKDTIENYEKNLENLLKENTINVNNTVNSIDEDSFAVYQNNYSYVYLQKFWKSLKDEEYNLKPIHIAYFGDSEIEGDLITSDLRYLIQEKFGGSGVGFLPLSAVDAEFRNQVCFKFDEENIQITSLNKTNKNYDYGISGAVFEPISDFTVKYIIHNNQSNFDILRVFYKISDSTSTPYFYINKNKIEIIAKDEHLSQYVTDIKINTKQLEFIFPANQSKFYGISLEQRKGIYVDNFSLRGYSGATLDLIPIENLKRFNKFMNYRLIILQYGMNVLSDEIKNYTYYKMKMINVIKHFKKAFPDADILIISVGDKGKKIGNKYITDANIFNLIKSQKELAEETNVSFINLYDLMGGFNTIVNWVSKGYAAPDYVHLTRSGAKIIAKKIFDIISNYNYKITSVVGN